MKHIKLYEEYTNEFLSFAKTKPLTDEEIIKYMESHPARKKMLDEFSKPGKEVQKQAMLNFFRENPHYVKDDEAPANIFWDNKEKKFKRSGNSSGAGYGYSQFS